MTDPVTSATEPFAQQTTADPVYRSGRVVVIHGIGANTIVMGPLARYLTRHEFTATRWGYWSTFNGLRDHARRLRLFLETFADDDQPVHFVTHSMGGIILRATLAEMNWSRPGRAVLLAPPNHGSLVAGWFGMGLRGICPALNEISAAPESLVHHLPPFPSMDIGVIGCRQDALVAMASTFVANQRDHITVGCGHNWVLVKREVQAEVVHFLQFGRFSDSADRLSADDCPVL
ncbi:alpha/beta fold hydrolase [Bremerella sp. JC817]|uniref:esterase/lipase family protein n=1 Tax=Bremerella sp. JC817 TaxID=3231756 RepID=UPI00345AA2BF